MNASHGFLKAPDEEIERLETMGVRVRKISYASVAGTKEFIDRLETLRSQRKTRNAHVINRIKSRKRGRR